MTAVAGATDERLAGTGRLKRMVLRPELGSVLGAIIIFAFFASQSAAFRSPSGIANWLDPAALLGIMAVAVSLLMIGGEFDLSAGVMTAATGLTTGMLAVEAGWNIWFAMLASLVLALAIGFMNGMLVIKTGLHSFIITLGTFLMFQGINLGVTRLVTGGVQVSDIDEAAGYDTAQAIFASTVTIAGVDVRVSIFWWLALLAVATWVLLRTRPGNWIFSAGGNPEGARNAGVPAARTKVALFMTVSASAWLVGNITALRLGSMQAITGVGQELIYIACAVIGGCLLTGGYGSAIGASVGALIFGMATKGIVYVGWDSTWFLFFLGAMLLLAVLSNNFVRKRAEEARR